MENKNVILLKHHPMNVHYDNDFYTKQVYGDINDYKIIDVTSRVLRNKKFMEHHPTFAEDVSPFYMGPVTSSDGVTSTSLEALWQCGKVYPCHDDHGHPTEEWMKWRNENFGKKASGAEMRYPGKELGYTEHDVRYYAWYNEKTNRWEYLDYLTARKRVYIPAYARMVVHTRAYRYLKKLYDEGRKIALVDFDAMNYYSYGAKMAAYDTYVSKCHREGVKPMYISSAFDDVNTMKDYVNFIAASIGHAYIIKMLLEGDIKVMKDGSISDPQGMLR